MENKVVQHIGIILSEDQAEGAETFLRAPILRQYPELTIDIATHPSELANKGCIDVLICPIRGWLDDVDTYLPKLWWLHFLSSGVDGIWDRDFNPDNYLITNSRGIHAIPIAEYAVGAILFLLKQFGEYQLQQQNRLWRRTWLNEATYKTALILGTGVIGTEIAKRCKQLGMRTEGVSNSGAEADYFDRTTSINNIQSVLSAADIVIFALPLTRKTHGLMDEELLSHMKDGVYIIDVSRGGIILESALVKGIRSGRIGGAVLDVFENEPLSGESDLWDLPNVLITPHVSGTTPFYLQRAGQIFLDNLHSYHNERKLVTVINPSKQY